MLYISVGDTPCHYFKVKINWLHCTSIEVRQVDRMCGVFVVREGCSLVNLNRVGHSAKRNMMDCPTNPFGVGIVMV